MANNGVISAQTPNFLISMDDYFDSETTGSTILLSEDYDTTGTDLPDIENYAILYEARFSVRKVIATDTGSNLFSSARLQGSLLHVLIASGAYVADLENAFVTGTVVDTTTIAKISNVNGTSVPVDINVFENCYIVEMTPIYDPKTNMDFCRMEIRYNKRTHTVRKFNQAGILQGSGVSAYDFGLNSNDGYTDYDDET